MFGKKNVVTITLGIAAMALPAFSQSEDPGKNEVSVQALGSFVKSTTSSPWCNSILGLACRSKLPYDGACR